MSLDQREGERKVLRITLLMEREERKKDTHGKLGKSGAEFAYWHRGLTKE